MTETAVFGGGCFWCTEAIFKNLRGVISAIPGYAGGTAANPTYEEVCSGKTGHAEVIQIEFNPRVIPYQDLLDVFWNTHDPTTLNRQGSDVGPQYRSVIFFTNMEQKKIAELSLNKLEQLNKFKDPIVTEIKPLDNFIYEAEDDHKNYYEKNMNAPYCQLIISPKLIQLKEKYSRILKS